MPKSARVVLSQDSEPLALMLLRKLYNPSYEIPLRDE